MLIALLLIYDIILLFLQLIKIRKYKRESQIRTIRI